MTADLRFRVIRHTVAELAGFEGEVAGKLERAWKLSFGHPDALAAIQRLRPMVQTHRDQLASYLKESGWAEPSGKMTSPRSTSREATTLSESLRDLCLAVPPLRTQLWNAVRGGATALSAASQRDRAGASKAHADAALSTARLLPSVVAWQLAQDGLLCACTCPMCGLGACACVAWGTETLIAAWRDAAPTESEPPGFVLQIPGREAGWRGSGCKAEICSSRLMVNRCAPPQRLTLRSASAHSGTRCVS